MMHDEMITMDLVMDEEGDGGGSGDSTHDDCDDC